MSAPAVLQVQRSLLSLRADLRMARDPEGSRYPALAARLREQHGAPAMVTVWLLVLPCGAWCLTRKKPGHAPTDRVACGHLSVYYTAAAIRALAEMLLAGLRSEVPHGNV